MISVRCARHLPAMRGHLEELHPIPSRVLQAWPCICWLSWPEVSRSPGWPRQRGPAENVQLVHQVNCKHGLTADRTRKSLGRSTKTSERDILVTSCFAWPFRSYAQLSYPQNAVEVLTRLELTLQPADLSLPGHQQSSSASFNLLQRPAAVSFGLLSTQSLQTTPYLVAQAAASCQKHLLCSRTVTFRPAKRSQKTA